MKNRINRRSFLKGVGGTVVALPFLEALAPRVARGAGSAAPRRFVTWFTSNGTIVDRQMCPSPVTSVNGSKLGEKRDHAFSQILAPLERHRADMLILEGIRVGDARLGYGNGGHSVATSQGLTGRAPLAGHSPETSAGISLDQHLADHFAGETRIHSLNLGVQVTPGGSYSWRGPNQEVPVRNNPYSTFEELFQDLPSGGESSDAFARRIRRKASVLDCVLDNARSLERRISAADRQRLAQHMDAIRAVEMQLASSDVPCASPDLGQPIDYMANDNVPVVLKLQMDIMALALACDLTRVGILEAGEPGGGYRVHSWLDQQEARTGGWHGVSHDPGFEDGITAINIWYYEQLAYFIDKLKDIPDVDGSSVLDNTVVLGNNEYGQNDHTPEDMPYILFGSCGGYFKTGRCLVYNSSDSVGIEEHQHYNALLTTIQNAMGVPGIFGADELDNREMPELSNLIT